MGIVLLLSLIVLTVINRMYLNTLSEKLLSEMQSDLTFDCEELNEKLYSSIQIPPAIESTHYYRYLATPTGNDLELKYYPVLDLLQKALQKQVYLTSNAEESLLFLRRYNSIVGLSYYERVAEDYFTKHLIHPDGEAILRVLRSRDILTCFPMQKVILDGVEKECLTIILSPKDNSTSIVNLYSKEMLMRNLGIEKLPDESKWTLIGENGQVLVSSGTLSSNSGKVYELTGVLLSFHIQVRLEIPENYLNQMLAPARNRGFIAILLVTFLGSLLAVGFSFLSVRPIKNLISSHKKSNSIAKGNELLSLDELLKTSHDNESKMQIRLQKQVLARIFYSGIISQEEEDQLREQIPYLRRSFRIAIFRTSSAVNAVLGKQFELLFPDGVWTMLSSEETGLLFEAEKENVTALTRFVYQMNLQLENEGLFCGVSDVCSGVSELNSAVKQARRAIPAEPGINFDQKKAVESDSLVRTGVERLRQSIVSGDEEGALNLLGGLARESRNVNSDGLFHVILFTLQNAASELGVVIPQAEEYEFHPTLSQEGNIRNLSRVIRWVFDAVRSEKENEKQSLKRDILEHINRQLSNSELNAAMIAEEFGITEKRVYETVRMVTGKTFKEYVTNERMNKAASLLFRSEQDIAEIADACGYNNASTFYRLFRSYYGISPGSFRKTGTPTSLDSSMDGDSKEAENRDGNSSDPPGLFQNLPINDRV
ncbi:MAG: helix-turn-helix domain-containing protein [Lachnospiraceae bacterium]|nr:helix-turn-helix domain-containing protein [Lachnospiraceae bacterium]